jgi:hypothetical protein
MSFLLLFIGIHNAWDTVTYVVVARWERHQGRDSMSGTATAERTDDE